jgi:hypothetical protein
MGSTASRGSWLAGTRFPRVSETVQDLLTRGQADHLVSDHPVLQVQKDLGAELLLHLHGQANSPSAARNTCLFSQL